jgi:hypothetical protein
MDELLAHIRRLNGGPVLDDDCTLLEVRFPE